MSRRLISFSTLLTASLLCQSLPPVSQVGYGPVFPELRVAPGQMTPIRVDGIKVLEGQGYRFLSATAFPLPTTLGAVTALVSKGDFGNTLPRVFEAIPVLAIEQFSTLCDYTAAENDSCLSAVVTVQIPFDLPPDPSPTLPLAGRPSLIKLRVGSRETTGVRLAVDRRRPHIIRSCDKPGGRRAICDLDFVTSASGMLVRTRRYIDGAEPVPGEIVVVYAYGLGRTEPEVLAGAEVTRASALILPLPIRLEWLAPNGGVVEQRDVDSVYAGLTPGSAGLYQVNVAIPPMPDAVQACDGRTVNFRITLVAPAADDSVELCVGKSK